jgi:lysozyme family protein
MSNFREYLEFTEQREGGLSKAKTDNASKYPVPDGSGYHTNKGITWETFERLSDKLGYEASPKIFYKMPDEIFEKIFEYYWNLSGANLINNQAIANLVFQALWGGGHKELVTKIQKYFRLKVDFIIGKITASTINSFPDQKQLYNTLHQARLDYLRSLKSYQDNGKGWERRMKKLYDFNQKYL